MRGEDFGKSLGRDARRDCEVLLEIRSCEGRVSVNVRHRLPAIDIHPIERKPAARAALVP
jgi:hypothetical protein